MIDRRSFALPAAGCRSFALAALFGASTLVACGPSKSESDQDSAAGADGSTHGEAEAKARCIGAPRSLPDWHEHLRKLAAAGRLSELRAGPSGEGDTWQLCLEGEVSAAQPIEDLLGIAAMNSAPPEKLVPLSLGQVNRRLDLAASEGGSGWLPAGAQVIVMGDAKAADPVTVVGSKRVWGQAPADAVVPSELCLPGSAPFDASAVLGAAYDGASTSDAAKKARQETFDRAVHLPYGEDRVWIEVDAEAQTATVARVRVQVEGCEASSDGAAITFSGVLDDVTVEGETVVLHHRDALDPGAEVSTTRWTPEVGKVQVRARPPAPDADALLKALSGSKVPLTGELDSCLTIDQALGDEHFTLDTRLAQVRRGKKKSDIRVECLAAATGDPRKCMARFGDLLTAKEGDYLELEFEATAEGVRPTGCVSL